MGDSRAMPLDVGAPRFFLQTSGTIHWKVVPHTSHFHRRHPVWLPSSTKTVIR